MNTALSGMLAIELRSHAPGNWIATYYPVVATATGRTVDVNLALHAQPLPAEHAPGGAAIWLEADSPDPSAPCYAGHEAWAPQLAAGYDHALTVYDTETVDEQSSIEDPDAVRAATVLVDSARFPQPPDTEALDLPGKRLLGQLLRPARAGTALRRLQTATFCRD